MLKVGLIGHGNIGSCHIGNFYRFNRENDLLNLTCVVDFRAERLAAVKQDERPIALYRSIDEMLDKEELDMVTVALPTYLHHDVAIKCMRHGIHVLCEKPMSVTVRECQEMIDVSRETGKRLMIAQCLRFNGQFVKAKELAESGKYGKVVSVSYIRSGGGGDFRGFNNWFLQKELSGGGLYDLHIHDADIMRYCFGDPISLSAVKRKVYENSDNDAFAGIYTYPGFFAVCQSDWAWKGGKWMGGYIINYENATLFLQDGKLLLGERGKPAYEIEPSFGDDMYYNETKYFAECIRDNRENTVNPPEESLKTIRLLNMEEKSGEMGGATVIL